MLGEPPVYSVLSYQHTRVRELKLRGVHICLWLRVSVWNRFVSGWTQTFRKRRPIASRNFIDGMICVDVIFPARADRAGIGRRCCEPIHDPLEHRFFTWSGIHLHARRVWKSRHLEAVAQ